MSTIYIQGRIAQAGASQYGDYAIVAEPGMKRDGTPFEARYMCSAAKNESVPPEGTQVVVTGYARAKVSERDGKHYANIQVSAARFTPLGESAPKPADDEDAPF